MKHSRRVSETPLKTITTSEPACVGCVHYGAVWIHLFGTQPPHQTPIRLDADRPLCPDTDAVDRAVSGVETEGS